MDCPKCQGFLLLEPGPLAFDDYRCINRECRHTLRLPHARLRNGDLAPARSASALPATAADYCITQVVRGRDGRRSQIPRDQRVAMGLCIECCARRDGDSPRCKGCRARLAASVQRCWLKKHPNAKVRVHHGAVA